jgi:hypothetical protein
LWINHLQGVGPILGIVPIRNDNTCYWGAIDVDDDNINHAAVVGIVEAADLPLITCRSKSGAAHLYVFFSEPVPVKIVKDGLRKWANAMGFIKNPDGTVVEVFPKNNKLNLGDKGNWINLPYYGAKGTNRYAVNDIGKPLTFEQFLPYAEGRAISEARFLSLDPQHTGPFADGPPCLQTLNMIGYPEGTRSMGIYNVGIYLKLSAPDTWESDVDAYNNEHMDPPLKPKEIEGLIRSLKDKDYAYKCDDLPIQPHCKKVECKKRAFGIDVFRKKKVAAEMPVMGTLQKVMTDPPRWLVDVDGLQLDLETDELMSLAMFRKAVMERCSRIFPMLKMGEWDDVLKGLLSTHTTIEAPKDAGTMGQFKALFSEFLMRRFHASTLEDVLTGLPYEDVKTKVVYFRSIDLTTWLDRKKFRSFDSSHLFTTLRGMGAGYRQVKLKGATMQIWSIAVPSDEQTEPLNPPSKKGASY